ncbi:hypothetical protein D3C71_1929320 [compost metagenome]
MDAVKSCFFLIIGLHHPPRRFGDVGAFQHYFLGLGIGFPAPTGLQIHWAEFPLLERVVNATEKAQVLFLVGNGEPIFD